MNEDADYVLDEEEQEILDRFNQGKLRSPINAAEEMEMAREAARNTLGEWRQVTLHVTEQEYILAHARAAKEGVPCPALL